MSRNTTHEQQKSNSTLISNMFSVWFNRIFFVIIILAIPFLYYFGYFDKEWINRIGIAFNFFAGFMVAPELIGDERLKRIEDYLENIFTNRKNVLERNYSSVIDYFNTENSHSDETLDRIFRIVSITMILTIILIAFLVWFHYYLYSCIVLILVYFFILVFAVNNLEAANSKTRVPFSERVRSFFSKYFIKDNLMIPLFFMYLPIWHLSVKLIILIFSLIQKPFVFIVNKLSGDAQLRHILVRWGVILFIIGNVLQFVATF